jgi:hypothetical protein
MEFSEVTPISPRSPWQNGRAERLIGSIRRECRDHIVVVGERHLRHVLLSYMEYHDTPIHRAAQTIGTITSRPILGGLHHHYCRI